MKLLLISLCVATGLVSATGCNTTHEDVVKTEQKSEKVVAEAKKNMAAAERDAAQKIDAARAQGNFAKIEEKKIAATKDIARAEQNVDAAKVQATEDITEAKKKAGESTGTLQRQ